MSTCCSMKMHDRQAGLPALRQSIRGAINTNNELMLTVASFRLFNPAPLHRLWHALYVHRLNPSEQGHCRARRAGRGLAQACGVAAGERPGRGLAQETGGHR